MCIIILFFIVLDIINLEIINLSFLIKPFSYMTKKSGQKFKYLKNENSFEDDIKCIFNHFLRVFIRVNKTNFSGKLESVFKSHFILY